MPELTMDHRGNRSSDFRIRKNMHATLTKKFMDVMQDYQVCCRSAPMQPKVERGAQTALPSGRRCRTRTAANGGHSRVHDAVLSALWLQDRQTKYKKKYEEMCKRQYKIGTTRLVSLLDPGLRAAAHRGRATEDSAAVKCAREQKALQLAPRGKPRCVLARRGNVRPDGRVRLVSSQSSPTPRRRRSRT